MKKTVYYTHCMAIYNTDLESSDIKKLEDMGFKVINPNSKIHINEVKRLNG